MKKIGIVVIVLLVILGGYIYVKMLLGVGSVIKDDFSTTTSPITTDAVTIDTVTKYTVTTIATSTVDKERATPVDEGQKEDATPVVDEDKDTAPPDKDTTPPVKDTTPPVEEVLSVTGALGTAVEKKTLIGKATEFNADVGKVYLLTTIKADSVPTEIEHVWYYNGKEKARTRLPVTYKRHRTWSYKTIVPGLIGDWRVDVVDMSGKVLKSFPFVIRE
jgi:hypothetical protein